MEFVVVKSRTQRVQVGRAHLVTGRVRDSHGEQSAEDQVFPRQPVERFDGSPCFPTTTESVESDVLRCYCYDELPHVYKKRYV